MIKVYAIDDFVDILYETLEHLQFDIIFPDRAFYHSKFLSVNDLKFYLKSMLDSDGLVRIIHIEDKSFICFHVGYVTFVAYNKG